MQLIAHHKLAKVRVKRNYSYCKSSSPDKKEKADILGAAARINLQLGNYVNGGMKKT